MDHERLGRAVWAAELRRKGTLLSDEAVADVCEALLEVAGAGTITLELHEQVVATLHSNADERVKRVEEAARDRIEELKRRLGAHP